LIEEVVEAQGAGEAECAGELVGEIEVDHPVFADGVEALEQAPHGASGA